MYIHLKVQALVICSQQIFPPYQFFSWYDNREKTQIISCDCIKIASCYTHSINSQLHTWENAYNITAQQHPRAAFPVRVPLVNSCPWSSVTLNLCAWFKNVAVDAMPQYLLSSCLYFTLYMCGIYSRGCLQYLLSINVWWLFSERYNFYVIKTKIENYSEQNNTPLMF